MGDGYFDVPLHLGWLLGKAPYGNFIVRLRGPLGRSAELPLRILPHLEICGHDPATVLNVGERTVSVSFGPRNNARTGGNTQSRPPRM